MSSAIAALKAWALAEVVMAAVFFGAWHSLRFENPAASAPKSPLIAGLELAYLVPLLAALALSWRWWKSHRCPLDSRTKWGLLSYSLASIASFALWDNATTLAEVRPLYALDAAIALTGLWPALSLIALIRQTAARP